jgi:hypothetical protein
MVPQSVARSGLGTDLWDHHPPRVVVYGSSVVFRSTNVCDGRDDVSFSAFVCRFFEGAYCYRRFLLSSPAVSDHPLKVIVLTW